MSTPQLQRTVPELLGNIVDNIQQIIRSEFRLAKAELQEKISKAFKPATTLGAGFLLGFYGFGFLLLAAVYALSTVMAAGLAALIMGGVVLSALLPSPSRARKTYPPESTTAEDRNDSAPSYNSSTPTLRKPNDLRKTIEALTGALLGVAVNQASGFLDSLLPGFHQEFTKARASKDKNSGGDNSPIDASNHATTKDSTSPKPLTSAASA